ncbi:MAG: metallophosphoesterase [Planctomycetia bacterium]|nr:metallophosphoesterase [Planctomycetia bacterium]
MPRRLRLPGRALALAAVVLLAACGGGGGGGAEPSPFPAGVVHGPVVGAPSPGTLVVAWRTAAPSVGAVEFGPTPSYGAVVAESSPTTDHELALPAAGPRVTRHFRLLADGQPLGGDHAVRTLPGATDTARLAVAGDVGTGTASARAVRDVLAATDPDALLLLGDLGYDDGTEADQRAGLLVPYAALLARTPTFTVLGNHDVRTAGGAALLGAVPLPTNVRDGSERYYAVDVGPVHLAVLDSNADLSASSAQRAWLDGDLAATSRPWRVVAFHHLVYSSGEHGDTPGLAASLGPVLDARGVDLVLAGHDHDYERTHPVLAGAATDTSGGPAYADPSGPVYVVSGGGGAELTPVGRRALTATSVMAFHGLEVVATPTSLAVTVRRADGVVIDAFTLTR